ncbi:hypothetical protein GCM10007901_25520 [Dyella acidisoli]|uniref:Uncharacterized protein n=1 Tax=Dyella acidisoli TaxID=1867834 RepID=A0ABQ5XQQ1_9GAMM|nr:hypothetical protein GCM10007901_25520 [Dyella acidisoli]
MDEFAGGDDWAVLILPVSAIARTKESDAETFTFLISTLFAGISV